MATITAKDWEVCYKKINEFDIISREGVKDWQVLCSGVKERSKHLLSNGLWSDCKFLLGANRVSVTAHRVILAMSSPVFEAMLFGVMSDDQPVTIPDVEPETFQSLLEYVYGDDVNITSVGLACDLYHAAHKYMLVHLVRECAAYISANMSPEDACRCYELASLYDDTNLMNDVLMLMSVETKDVLTSSSFEDAELSTVEKLFSLQQMHVDSELDLLDAAERYVRAQYKNIELADLQVEDKLEEQPIRCALKKIRFLTLTAKEFAEKETALLTDRENLAILKNILSPNTRISIPSGFSTCKSTRNMQVITCKITDIWDDYISPIYFLGNVTFRIEVMSPIHLEEEHSFTLILTIHNQSSDLILDLGFGITKILCIDSTNVASTKVLWRSRTPVREVDDLPSRSVRLRLFYEDFDDDNCILELKVRRFTSHERAFLEKK